MKTIMAEIIIEASTIYRESEIYKHTIWQHALRVSKAAFRFSEKIGANPFVARVAGLLHDIGAAKYGKSEHHITGAWEALPILLKCGCPTEFIAEILHAIRSHRGSQKIPFMSKAGICVAAADALDHFRFLREVWNAHVFDLKMSSEDAYRALSTKLENDWSKISPEIKDMLDGTYKRALLELESIASTQ